MNAAFACVIDSKASAQARVPDVSRRERRERREPSEPWTLELQRVKIVNTVRHSFRWLPIALRLIDRHRAPMFAAVDVCRGRRCGGSLWLHPRQSERKRAPEAKLQQPASRECSNHDRSNNQLSNRLCAFNADKLLIEASVEVGEMVRIEAKALQRGRVQVLHVVAIIDAG